MVRRRCIFPASLGARRRFVESSLFSTTAVFIVVVVVELSSDYLVVLLLRKVDSRKSHPTVENFFFLSTPY